MKRQYQTPRIKVVLVMQTHHLLAGSEPNFTSTNTIRESAGSPTSDGLGIDIFSASENDPGGTIRSREIDWGL